MQRVAEGFAKTELLKYIGLGQFFYGKEYDQKQHFEQ